MNTFLTQIEWQFRLLQRNNIISISLAVTIIYGLILYIFRDVEAIDKVLVALVLNDPAMIGYYFIALSIYIEKRYDILQAIFITPINIHKFLLSKTLSVSILGVICSIGLIFSVKGFDFDIISFIIGSFGICTLSALSGLIILPFASEFLKFVMLSIPLFLAFINIPLLQYLGAIDIGIVKYFFPVQGSIDLIDYAVSKTPINFWYSYLSIIVTIPFFYLTALQIFAKKIVYQ